MKKLLFQTFAVILTISMLTYPFTTTYANTNEFSDEFDKVELPDVSQESDSDNNDENSPSLIPGDFFYFLKTFVEKIQLAFTFDDVEEAKLLASFAEERIKEAEELFKSGDEDLALETLKEAVELMDDVEKVKEALYKEDESEDHLEESKNNVETPSEDDTKKEDINNVDELLSANIIALSKNLEKIDNPNAKDVLRKNLEKHKKKLQEKLKKRLQKLEEKNKKSPVEDPLIPVEMEEGTELQEPIKVDEIPEDDLKIEQQYVHPSEKQSKDDKKQQKAKFKEEKKQQKQETKEKRKEMKQNNKKEKKDKE